MEELSAPALILGRFWIESRREKWWQSWTSHIHLTFKENLRAGTKKGTQASARHLARSKSEGPIQADPPLGL